MGWRTLKSGDLLVRKTEILNSLEPDCVTWVTLEFNYQLQCMKIGFFKNKSDAVASSTLVLSSKAVNIEVATSHPTSIVNIKAKDGSTYLLSAEGLGLNVKEVLHWRNLFQSAINPTGTFSVTVAAGEKPAILSVQDKSVLQLSMSSTSLSVMSNRRISGPLADDNIISTDVSDVKLTVEDCISFKLDNKFVSLRTNRLVELYQRLLRFLTGENCAEIQIAGPAAQIATPCPRTSRATDDRRFLDIYEDPYGYVLPDFPLKKTSLSSPPLTSPKMTTMPSPSSPKTVVTKQFNTFHRSSTVTSLSKLSPSQVQLKNLKISPPMPYTGNRIHTKPEVLPKPNVSTKSSSSTKFSTPKTSDSGARGSTTEVVYATVSKTPASSVSRDPLQRFLSAGPSVVGSSVGKHDYENLNRVRKLAEHTYQNKHQTVEGKLDKEIYENVGAVLKKDITSPVLPKSSSKRLPSPVRADCSTSYTTKRPSINGKSATGNNNCGAPSNQSNLRMPGNFANTILQFDRSKLRSVNNNLLPKH